MGFTEILTLPVIGATYREGDEIPTQEWRVCVVHP